MSISEIIAGTQLTTFIGWTVLPPLLSRAVLAGYYRLYPLARPTVTTTSPPAEVQLQNSRAQKHDRIARVSLVAIYLLYTLAATYLAQGRYPEANFYTMLGIRRSQVESEGPALVKSHWRRLARTYHPDKVGKQGEKLFVELRRGVEVLENDTKRWAYERFGPSIIDWHKCVTHRDYMGRGAQVSIGFYVVALLSITMLKFFRTEENDNSFWRYVTLLITLATEMRLLLAPNQSTFFSFFLPNRLTFEHIAFLRQFFLSSHLAFSQIAPFLFPAPPTSQLSAADEANVLAMQDAEALRPILTSLQEAMNHATVQSVLMQQAVYQPLIDAHPLRDRAIPLEQQTEILKEVFDSLRKEMHEVWVDQNLMNDPDTSGIWKKAFEDAQKIRNDKLLAKMAIRDATALGANKTPRLESVDETARGLVEGFKISSKEQSSSTTPSLSSPPPSPTNSRISALAPDLKTLSSEEMTSLDEPKSVIKDTAPSTVEASVKSDTGRLPSPPLEVEPETKE